MFIFILIIIIAFTGKIASSRFNSEANKNGNLNIAKPIVELEQVSSNNFTNMKPGDTVEYTFNVKNNNGSNTNEVTMNYYIEVTYNNNNLPLTYEIYDITTGSEVQLTTNNNQTNLLQLGLGNIETHNFKIKFIWPQSSNSYTYSSQNISFDIDVYAEQVIS